MGRGKDFVYFGPANCHFHFHSGAQLFFVISIVVCLSHTFGEQCCEFEEVKALISSEGLHVGTSDFA